MSASPLNAQNAKNKIELKFVPKGTYKHDPGKQFKLFPFKTNPGGDKLSEDFRTFHGIIGELFRIIQKKAQLKSERENRHVRQSLKDEVLKQAIEKVNTDRAEDLYTVLSDLFFDETGSLVKFHINTLSYMNFVNAEYDHALKNVSQFVFDIFFSGVSGIKDLGSDPQEENLFHQLILNSLPELPSMESKNNEALHKNLLPELEEHFLTDFNFLKSKSDFLLKYIEDFVKFYYFQYLSQTIAYFNEFGSHEINIKPIHFTLDWETLSQSRLASHQLEWKRTLGNYSHAIFAHANALELLNYIYVNDVKVGDYHSILTIYEEMSDDDKEALYAIVEELITRYAESISKFDTGEGWEECERQLSKDIKFDNLQHPLQKLLYKLWFNVRYQFENSDRKKPYQEYEKWYTNFCKQNFLKNRGRLGYTVTLTQEYLLFLTRLCIGAENKIRLKELWAKFEERGIQFDEITKSEIVRLFEKINLIEKKSDSGDAQYVKSII